MEARSALKWSGLMVALSSPQPLLVEGGAASGDARPVHLGLKQILHPLLHPLRPGLRFGLLGKISSM